MLTYKEHIELREKLAKGEITQDLAKELYWKDHKEGKRSWDTKDWKDRRKEIIKEKCEICGRTEKLTLQHRSRPQKYSKYEREVSRKYTRLFIDSNASVKQREFIEHLKKNFDYVPVPLCPKCNSRHPDEIMGKTPQYFCTECRLEFDEPIYKAIEELVEKFYSGEDGAGVRDKCFMSKGEWNDQQNLSQVKYWLQREKANTKFSDDIEKEAFLLFLDDCIKYLSFEDTITACNKCAFCFDLNDMDICPKCKKYYKNVSYPTCINCLPEDRRKAALKTIGFYREMRRIHQEY